MITVIGLGFVGLTTSLGFSEKGYKVYGYDIDKTKTDQLKINKVPFYEPNLQEMLQKHINKNFELVDNLNTAIKNSNVIFYCIGTPSRENAQADLSYIYGAIKDTLAHIPKDDFKVLVIKSTIPPATTYTDITAFIEKNGFTIGKTIGLTNNPEFLREGYAWDDFVNPDRIVIGQSDDKSGSIVEELYKSFHSPIFRVSLNTAEYIKYLSNTLLATLISFSNEQSMIGKSIGNIDIKKAFEILHLDKRWNGNPASMASYVYPGCGFGGYCLPKDTKALIYTSNHHSYKPRILENVLQTNQDIKEFVVKDIIKNVDSNEIIGILGLSFKPNSDDIRDSPSTDIVQSLLNKGYKNIIAYDPISTELFKKQYNLPLIYASTLKELTEKAQHIVILTGWRQFIEESNILRQKNIFDYRYIL